MELAEGVETAIPALCKLALEAPGVWKTRFIIAPPGPYDIIRPIMQISYILYEPYIVVDKPKPCGLRTERKPNILTITNNPCKEFQLDGEELISNDFPLEALGLVFNPLIHLWGSNLC